MTCEGYVCEINGDKTYVNVPRESACGGNCASCEGCKDRNNKIEVINNIGAKKGDRVTVALSTRKVLGLSFIVYMLPIFLVILLTTLADAYIKSTVVTIIVALISVIVWLICVRLANKKAKITNEIIKIY